MNNGNLIEVRELKVHFGDPSAPVRAVDGVSLEVRRGETLGLVGESGCGKSTLGRTILRLEQPVSGSVRFDGRDVFRLRGAALQEYRRHAQMVFQDPFGSLNPRMTVGGAIEEVLKVHRRGRGAAARRARAAELFDAVGLEPAYLARYPHEFSGGQRQRIGIARALAVEPQLLIADEPVSALDVSVQVQILNLLKDLKAKMNLSYIFVAHDLAVVRYVSDRVVVMYLGRVVESAPAADLYAQPAHPYAEALLAAVPDVVRGLKERRTGAKRRSLAGDIPSGTRVIPGCSFHPRCPRVRERCRLDVPALREVAPLHFSACHFAEEVVGGAK